jgi:hypothetical protein
MQPAGRAALDAGQPLADDGALDGPLAARHLSAHDVSLDLHRGVGNRDEPRGCVGWSNHQERVSPGRTGVSVGVEGGP